MKFLILICSMLSISTLKAETTQTVAQDDVLLKESNEALKCPPVVTQNTPAKAVAIDAVEIKPALDEQTQLVPEERTGEKAEDKTVAALEEELLPTKNLTATEKLKIYRTKLEERNLVLLEKKLEMIRLQQEMALLKNLENSMNKTLERLNKL